MFSNHDFDGRIGFLASRRVDRALQTFLLLSLGSVGCKAISRYRVQPDLAATIGSGQTWSSRLFTYQLEGFAEQLQRSQLIFELYCRLSRAISAPRDRLYRFLREPALEVHCSAVLIHILPSASGQNAHGRAKLS